MGAFERMFSCLLSEEEKEWKKRKNNFPSKWKMRTGLLSTLKLPLPDRFLNGLLCENRLNCINKRIMKREYVLFAFFFFLTSGRFQKIKQQSGRERDGDKRLGVLNSMGFVPIWRRPLLIRLWAAPVRKPNKRNRLAGPVAEGTQQQLCCCSCYWCRAKQSPSSSTDGCQTQGGRRRAGIINYNCVQVEDTTNNNLP